MHIHIHTQKHALERSRTHMQAKTRLHHHHFVSSGRQVGFFVVIFSLALCVLVCVRVIAVSVLCFRDVVVARRQIATCICVCTLFDANGEKAAQ